MWTKSVAASTVTLRRPRIDEVPGIVALINAFAARNLMLPRHPASVLQTMPDWLVAVGPNALGAETLLGCGALSALTPALAEVRSLAVHPAGQGTGIGSRIVARLLADAGDRGFDQVCAFTLRQDLFLRQGFVVVDRWSIRPKVRQVCAHCPKIDACDEVALLKPLRAEARTRVGAAGSRTVGITSVR